MHSRRVQASRRHTNPATALRPLPSGDDSDLGFWFAERCTAPDWHSPPGWPSLPFCRLRLQRARPPATSTAVLLRQERQHEPTDPETHTEPCTPALQLNRRAAALELFDIPARSCSERSRPVRKHTVLCHVGGTPRRNLCRPPTRRAHGFRRSEATRGRYAASSSIMSCGSYRWPQVPYLPTISSVFLFMRCQACFQRISSAAANSARAFP